ncbi:MAG: hypothetical protein J7K75_09635 [Desulfuromonas sp.]|nr:hypothetical protein [Desulfuromonas sp.]
MQRYSSPAAIARRYADDPQQAALAFSCSLCGLCNAICPEQLDLVEFFLKLRQRELAAHSDRLGNYKGLRFYERMGTSKPLSHYALPEGCDTVLFPGCALPGSRPQLTWQLYNHLQHSIPTLGLVLDCCTKPSHDLGDQ